MTELEAWLLVIGGTSPFWSMLLLALLVKNHPDTGMM